MEELINKYTQKLIKSGLAETGAPVFGARDVEIVWNQKNGIVKMLTRIFRELNINSVLYSPPAYPYRSIIECLVSNSGNKITPQDTETRTFLHDLPIVRSGEAGDIIYALKHRKGVLLDDSSIITTGTVSPEQAFITYSSICFASFVKYFVDFRENQTRRMVKKDDHDSFIKIFEKLSPPLNNKYHLASAPFSSEDEVISAIEEAGRLTVDCGMVDSYFGNISYRWGDVLYISQTGSSMDELTGCIDPCPLDQTSCAAITASSELPAHLRIVEDENIKAVLHGHPRFSVIMSMHCERYDCKSRGNCHRSCPVKRQIMDIPIVSGEVGAGRYGLCNSVPELLKTARGVIVYGHGVFTKGKEDFNEAFNELLSIEELCREEYFRNCLQIPGYNYPP